MRTQIPVFIFFLSLLFVSFVKGQTLETIIGSSGNDEFTSILPLSDGGYIISGSTSSINGFGNKDIYVVRLTSTYTVLWSKIYGGINEDAAYTSILNSNDNIIIVGSSASFNGGGNLDIFLIEIDIMGNVQWSRTFKTINFDETPRKIVKSDNGFVMCAISNFVGTTASPDMLVFEFSEESQSILWQNLIGSTDLSGDIPSSIISSSSGGYILVGGTKTFATNYDQIVMRLSHNGTIDSHIAYGGLGNENAQDAIELPNKDIIVIGNFRILSGNGLEMALTKINTSNTIEWIKTYGDNGDNDDRPYALRKSLDEGYVIAGYSYSYGNGNKDLALIDVDSDGNLLKSYNYGNNDGDEQPWDMILRDSEIVIVGSSSSISYGSNDAYLFSKKGKLDDKCFSVDMVQNNLMLSTHVFNYIENNPNLILDTIIVSQKEILLDKKHFIYNKKINGKIEAYLSQLYDLNLLNLEISLYNKDKNIPIFSDANIDKSGYFRLVLNSDQQLYLSVSNIDIPSHHLMKYRNGFDAFQMERIITNKVNDPLQIEPSPYAMIAADVDLSDKVRANDISLLQEVIVKKREGFPQQLPAELRKDYLDWRFIDQTTVNHEDDFKKASQYPYYSSKGYCRDNVPDIPFYLDNQGSCDENYTETYSAILLGDLVNGGIGVNLESFNTKASEVSLDIDDVHDLGNNIYRVFFSHTLAPQDKFVSFDFSMDYDDGLISIVDTKMTLEDDQIIAQWLSNDYNREELLFTSYSTTGYPLKGNLLYFDLQKLSGSPTIEDLGQLHVFVNGTEVPASIRLRSKTSTGNDIYKDVNEFVTLYPNPTAGRLTVSLPLVYSKDVHIEIQNTIGQSVYSYDQKQAKPDIDLDLSTLPSGLYQCLINIEGKATVVKKVVVK